MASPTGTVAAPQLKPARVAPNFNVKHGIRFSFRQGATPAGEDAIAAMPVGSQHHIGTIPKGSLITDVDLHVRTLVNGTTPAFIIGTVGDDDGILTAAASAVATAAFKPDLVTGALIGFTPVDMPLYAKLTTASTITAGEAHVVIEYYPQSN